jgi:hypothetical protein
MLQWAQESHDHQSRAVFVNTVDDEVSCDVFPTFYSHLAVLECWYARSHTPVGDS